MKADRTRFALTGCCKAPITTCELVDTPNRRVVDLTEEGVPEIPVLGMNKSIRTTEGSFFHRHDGCMEITYCDRGSVKFDGASFLQSTAETDLGRNPYESPTWFVVLNPTNDVAKRKDVGLFGLVSNGQRFGAFFPTADNGQKVQCYVGGNDLFLKATVKNAWQVLDTTAQHQLGDAMWQYVGIDGRDVASGAQKAYLSTSSILKVGHFREDAWGKPFPGQIAEIRVYNRALDPVERLLVERELAEKYGLAFESPFINATHASDAGYTNGMTVAGYWSDGDFGRTAANGDYLLAGHGEQANAWIQASSSRKRMKRAWYLERTNMAGVDVALSFDLESAALAPIPEKERPVYHLLKSTDGTVWTEVDAEPVATTRGFSFTIPSADYENGFYTLGAEVTPVGLVIIVR